LQICCDGNLQLKPIHIGSVCVAVWVTVSVDVVVVGASVVGIGGVVDVGGGGGGGVVGVLQSGRECGMFEHLLNPFLMLFKGALPKGKEHSIFNGNICCLFVTFNHDFYQLQRSLNSGWKLCNVSSINIISSIGVIIIDDGSGGVFQKCVILLRGFGAITVIIIIELIVIAGIP